MEAHAIPIGANTKAVKGSRWKRSRIELNGKSERNYNHEVSQRLMQSYAEIGAYPHVYHTWESPCRTHNRQSHVDSAYMLRILYSKSSQDFTTINSVVFTFSQSTLSSLGVSALEFDTKGDCLASVTRSGCLTVHKFESLYNHRNEFDQWENEKTGRLQHFSLFNADLHSISAVRWNPSTQNEIAYTTLNNGELTFFDIGYSQAVQVLRKRPPVGVLVPQGLSDIAFLNDGTRVLASDISGAISMWDRRVSDLPQMVLTTEKKIGLTSIQLLGDQCVYGASQSGLIHIWDIRGGRSSPEFQSDTEVHASPVTSVSLESMLNEIGPQKAHANRRPKVIQSIDINPACPHQLGFHLHDGCSGVLDMHNYRVSHIHCPRPPRWLNKYDHGYPATPPRKPSWLPEHSIYAAASTFRNGLHLLDFYPHPSSPCHLDYDDSKSLQETVERKQSVFVPLSKHVTACAVHPLDGTIVAGTMNASLITISQKHLCKKGDGDDDDDDEQS